MIGCTTSLHQVGKIFVLDHVLVPKEDKDNWLFFLMHLKQCFKGKLSLIISDRVEGPINAVKQAFPDVPHSKCLRHLSETFKKKFGQDRTNILKDMAMSYNDGDREMYLEVLKNGNCRNYSMD